MLPVLLLVTAFIVYGSLYPWQFHAATIAGNPLLILLSSWSLELNRYLVKDTAVNVVLYMPFGLASFLWLDKRPALVKLPLTLALAGILSSSLEMVQLFDARRVCSMIDVVTNLTGASIGALVAMRVRTTVNLRPIAAAPLFLLACWLGAMLFPFMPDLSVVHLNYKILALKSSPFSSLAFFQSITMWLVAARLMEAAVDRYVIPVLFFVLPARMLIVGLSITRGDALAAFCAFVLWFFWPQLEKPRDKNLAAILIATIVFTGLMPFHFSDTAQQFSWIPFRALFSTEWQGGVAIFFRKSFLYGSAIWLLVEAGFSLLGSALGIITTLAGLEVAQLWLPNHAAESTDPIHALILSWVIGRIPKATQTRKNASVRL